jgi:YVTN family beta-propeller protein
MMAKVMAIAAPCALLLVCGFTTEPAQSPAADIIVTAAPVYEPLAALRGEERFPKGAQLVVIHGDKPESKPEPLVTGFAATADANVSFDAKTVLFAGKRTADAPWQVWELTLADHSLRQIVADANDAIRPLYLPANHLVYAHRTTKGYRLEAAQLDGSAVQVLSYLPASAIPEFVLKDGRILFEAGFPLGSGSTPELFLVYSDGSGVESYRCDHGTARWGGTQLTSGDVVFTHGGALARFTSPLAAEESIAAPHAEYAGVGKAPVEVPLDELERYASQPFGVAIAPDKSRIYVTCGGSEIVTVVDVPRLLRFIHTHNGPFAQDLSASANYVVTRIPVGLNPRGLALSRDGRRLFVANRLDDTVSVIDTRANRAVSTITLSGSNAIPSLPFNEGAVDIASGAVEGNITCSKCHIDGRTQSKIAPTSKDLENLIDKHKNLMVPSLGSSGSTTVSPLRRGEQIFYTSRFSFRGQIGCANCHIDSTFDGIQWNLEPDGFGRNTVDNKILEGIKDTEPYKWTGTNPNIPTECGPRTEKYFWRSENYDNSALADLAVYVRSLAPRPNRWQQANGELTAAQERGKAIFERTVDKFKKPIPESNRCSNCHSGPKGTNQKIFDVGTRKPNDNTGNLKTPPLTNIALTAPYLHDGSARSLEEIWTVFNPEDKHGRTNDLTKDELNDLIEYLKSR